jgi:hypothetical protein
MSVTVSERAAWDMLLRDCRLNCEALIGLPFVVVMLIVERSPLPAAAFATPTIVYFGTALLSALLRASLANDRVGRNSLGPQLIILSCRRSRAASARARSNPRNPSRDACHDGELIAGGLSLGRPDGAQGDSFAPRPDQGMRGSRRTPRAGRVAVADDATTAGSGRRRRSMPASQKLAARPSASVPLLWAVRTTTATRAGVAAPQLRTKSAQKQAIARQGGQTACRPRPFGSAPTKTQRRAEPPPSVTYLAHRRANSTVGVRRTKTGSERDDSGQPARPTHCALGGSQGASRRRGALLTRGGARSGASRLRLFWRPLRVLAQSPGSRGPAGAPTGR